MRFFFGVASLVVCILVASGKASAQDCQPLPPSCQSASDRGTRFIERVEADGISGITDAASKAYCVLLVGIEVNNVCAAAYRQTGRNDCASLVDAQSAEYRQSLASAASTASAASVNNARNKCTFE